MQKFYFNEMKHDVDWQQNWFKVILFNMASAPKGCLEGVPRLKQKPKRAVPRLKIVPPMSKCFLSVFNAPKKSMAKWMLYMKCNY